MDQGKLEGAASEADEEEAAAPDAGKKEETAASEAGTSAEAGPAAFTPTSPSRDTGCTLNSGYR